MSAVPLILVVGGDALALRVCEELLATEGHRVALLWSHDLELAGRLDRLGCGFFPHAPNDYEALRLAGVHDAASIMALSDDDRLNLEVALKARDLNPQVRIVLRQFNRTLGRKLEQNLPNCSVLSLAAHSAATFVGSAVDRSCFYAVQFPDGDGVLAGFAERSAEEFGVAGLNVRAAQQKLRGRIIAVDASTSVVQARTLEPQERLVLFAPLEMLEATGLASRNFRLERRRRHLRRFAVGVLKRIAALRAMDPILARVIAGAVAIFAAAVAFFAAALHLDLAHAFYFVGTTWTSTGYGDITPLKAGVPAMLAANLVMFSGLAATGVFIAFAASALTRAQFTAMQGLRQIRTHGHVLLCGSGSVGTRVIDYLLALRQKIVVIEANPGTALVEMSRRRHIELLTGDATSDAALDLCNVQSARAVIALTDSDTANLEVALGVRARNPNVRVVMRAQDEAFAGSIARQFEALTTFSTSALAAPAFAMLSRFPGTRGRIAFGADIYNVGERPQGERPEPPPAEHCIPLGVWRNGSFVLIEAFEEMEPFDRLLFIVPLSQFRAGTADHQDRAAAIP